MLYVNNANMANNLLNKRTREGINDFKLLEKHLHGGDFFAAQKICLNLLKKGESTKQYAAKLIRDFYTMSLNRDAALSFIMDLVSKASHSEELRLELADIMFENRINYPDAESVAITLLEDLILSFNSLRAREKIFSVHVKLGNFEKAQYHLNFLNAADIDSYTKKELLAELLVAQGELTQAKEILEQICLKDYASVNAYKLFTQCHQFSKEEPEHILISELRKKLKLNKYNNREKSIALYILAKSALEQERYQEAFNYLNQASKTFSKCFNYNLEKDLEFFNTSSKLLDDVSFRKSDFKGRVFVLSFPNQIDEEFFSSLSNYLGYKHLPSNNFISHMIPGEKNTKISLSQIQKILMMNDEQLLTFQEYFTENAKLKIDSSNYFIDTTEYNFIYASIIKSIFPDAKFLFIKRDKLDALSNSFCANVKKENLLFSYNLKNLNAAYDTYISIVDKIKNKYKDDFIELELNSESFELDLLKNPNIKTKGESIEIPESKLAIKKQIARIINNA